MTRSAGVDHKRTPPTEAAIADFQMNPEFVRYLERHRCELVIGTISVDSEVLADPSFS